MAETERSTPWAEFKLCLGFLTRIPVGAISPAGTLARSCRWFPAVGALIGALSAAVLFLGKHIGLPDAVTVFIVLGISILVTGALHEDGIADVADGFGGGADRAAKLDIMRDSRIGTYGVLALILSVGLRWSLLTILSGIGIEFAVVGLIAAAATSRVAPILLMYRLAPARDDGLSAGAGKPETSSVRIASALGVAVLLLLPGWPSMLAAVAAVVIGTGLMETLSRHQISGQTGDVLGASQQVTEILVLLCFVAVWL